MAGEVAAPGGAPGVEAEPDSGRVATGEGVEPQGLGDEGSRVQAPAVLAEVEQVVARHAVVLEVARRVVVRRTPEGHGGAESPHRRMQDPRVDHRGDPRTAALRAQAVLVVVAPDEELRAR